MTRMMGTAGTALTMRSKMIDKVMTPYLRMSTIGTVGTPIPWTYRIALTIQATTRVYYHMAMEPVRTMMMSTATARAA